MEEKLSYIDFSAKMKSKYPEYKDVDDMELAQKIVDKYPEYKDVVSFDVKKKEELGAEASNSVAEPTTSAANKGLVSTPTNEILAEQPKKSKGKEVMLSGVNDSEEKEILSSAIDKTQSWYKDMGGITPFEKIEQVGERMKELDKEVNSEAIANMSEKDVKQLESDYQEKAKQIVSELGLNIDDDGNISVPENERKQFEDKLAFYLSIESKDRQKEAGFFENFVSKLASGYETFSANTLDMLGTLTGLNNIKSYKRLSEGSRLRSDQLSAQANRYDQSIEEYVKSGDVGAAAGLAVSSAFESLPSMIPVFANPTYGLYAMSAMSGIDKYRELESAQIPEWKKVYNAFITGASEYAGEKLVTIPILTRSKQALLSLGETRGKAAIEQAVKKTVESNASKLGRMPEWVAEGMSEVATGISTDLVDKVTVNPDVKIGAHAGDDFVVGAVMGKMFALPQDVAQIMNRQSAKKFAKEVVDKLPADMDVETKINIAWKIAERDALVNAENKLDDKFKGKYEERIVNLNTEIEKEVGKYSETAQPTVGKVEPVSDMQAQLDYLKEQEVDVPDGTTAEQLKTLYDETKAKLSDTPSGIKPAETVEKAPEQVQKVSQKEEVIATKKDFIKTRGVELAEDISDNELDKVYRQERVKKIKEDNTELDNQIVEAQKRLSLPSTPDIDITDDTELTLEQIGNEEQVPNVFVKNASKELYDRYNELEAMKQSDSRVYTTEQIESMQEYLGEEITKLEEYAARQSETGEFIGKAKVSEAAETGATEVVAEKEVAKESVNLKEKQNGSNGNERKEVQGQGEQQVLGTEPKEGVERTAFKTHTGEVVSGDKLTSALNKVADDWISLERAIRKEDRYAPHVTEAEKDDILTKGLETAEQIRRGEKSGEFWAWQRINEKLTGESVPLFKEKESVNLKEKQNESNGDGSSTQEKMQGQREQQLLGTEPKEQVEQKSGKEEKGNQAGTEAEVKKKLSELSKKIKAFTEKNGTSLTKKQSEEYSDMTSEFMNLKRSITKPISEDKIKSESERKSVIPKQIVVVAHEELISDGDVFGVINKAAVGVGYGEKTSIDEVVDGNNKKVSQQKLYGSFAKTRAALKEKYGDKITLYRAVGKQMNKPTTNWASTKENAKQYGNKVVEKEVNIDDIIAVNVGLNGNYEEFIVLSKPISAPVQPLSPKSGVEVPTEKKVAEKGVKEPSVLSSGQENKLTKETGIKPKNLRDTYKAGREIFGLNRSQALAQAIIVNTVVNKIAKNRGVTPEKVWGEIEFRKGLSNDANALYQAVWHGSPYEFDKFRLDKIGTGEGAQAFGWGLYFTDKISIARGYATNAYAMVKANADLIEDIVPFSFQPDVMKYMGRYENMSELRLALIEYYGNRNNGEWINKLVDGLKKRNLYKVKLHGDRSIDEFNYLRWDKYLDETQIEKIKKQAESEGITIDIESNKDELERIRNKYGGTFGGLISAVGKGNKEAISDRAIYTKLRATDSKGDKTYQSLVNLLGSPKAASLFLLRAGIDGIKYPTESTYKGSHEESFNYVIFDENVAEIEDHIKFQKQGTGKTAKGAIQFLADGNAIISALTNPNVSTPLHEIAHLYERYMPDSERKAVLKWAKHKTWSTETSEMFARGFEKYLATGKAPLPSLEGVFRRFKAWLTDIYNGITGSEIDVQLNDAMTDIYSAMLGKEVVQRKAKKEKVEKPVVYKKTFDDVDTLFQQESVPKTIEVEGVQRPTTNSNGQQIHSTLDGIKNFWKWFGDSKVVDKDGRPLVVYHGSPIGDISEFGLNKNESESSGLRQVAYYFTTNKKIAEEYRKKRLSEIGKDRVAKEIHKLEQLRDKVRNNTDWDEYTRQIKYLKGGRIYETYLKADNIKEFDAKGGDFESWKELKVDLGYKTAYGYDAIDALAGRNNAAWGDVKKDGIHAKNIVELSTYGKTNNDEFLGDAYAVFKPTQIKSATDNVGTFDAANPNILYQDPNELAERNKRHTQAVNNLVTNLKKEGEKDIPKAVRDYLSERGNPVSEAIVNGVLNERGYAQEQQTEVSDMRELARKNPASLLKMLDSLGITKRKC